MSENHIPLYPFIKPKENNNVSQEQIKKSEVTSTRKRRIRSDKCKDIKFPVSNDEQIRLKVACKKTDVFYKRRHGFEQKLTQTAFNTLLLRYGLNHINAINWDRPYLDTKIYMHTKPTQNEYDFLAGPQGIGTLHALSDRKLIYLIVITALEILERKEDYLNVLL